MVGCSITSYKKKLSLEPHNLKNFPTSKVNFGKIYFSNKYEYLNPFLKNENKTVQNKGII